MERFSSRKSSFSRAAVESVSSVRSHTTASGLGGQCSSGVYSVTGTTSPRMRSFFSFTGVVP